MPAAPTPKSFTIEQIIAPKGPPRPAPAHAASRPFTIEQIVAPKGPGRAASEEALKRSGGLAGAAGPADGLAAPPGPVLEEDRPDADRPSAGS